MLTIEEWVKEIKRSGKAIIVEGMKDRRALETLGIGNIHVLNKKPVYAVIEEVAARSKQAIILTDFDKTGKQLYGKLSSGLQHLGVEIDNRFREFLYKEKISHIEGLARYFETFKIRQQFRHQ